MAEALRPEGLTPDPAPLDGRRGGDRLVARVAALFVRIGENRPAQVAVLLGLVVLAFVVSSWRLEFAPGADVVVGSFFYLLAYRLFGLKAGLLTVFLLAFPMYVGSAQWLSIGLAFGHVLFLAALGPRARLMSFWTPVYLGTIGVLAGGFVMMSTLGLPPQLLAISFIRRILNETLLALAADLAVMTVHIVRRQMGRADAPMVRLSDMVSVSIGLVLMAAALFNFVVAMRQVPQTLERASRAAMSNAMLVALAEPGRTGSYVRRVDFAGLPAPLVLTEFRPSGPVSPAMLEQLGCRSVTYEDSLGRLQARSNLRDWLFLCRAVQIRKGTIDLRITVPMRPVFLSSFEVVFLNMVALLAIFMLLLVFRLFIRFFGSRVSRETCRFVQNLGKPDLGMPAGVPFVEFAGQLENFTRANNRHVKLAEERLTLARAVEVLQDSMQLQLLQGVCYDAASGRLDFLQARPFSGGEQQGLTVCPVSRALLASYRRPGVHQLELRFEEAGPEVWYLLMLGGHEADGRWSWGCLIRLRQANEVAERLRHQSRLIELGGMASALGHELRQPLSTIGMSAGNGAFLLRRNGPEDVARAAVKFERIEAQVQRAALLIERISSIGAPQFAARDMVDVVAAVRDTAEAMERRLFAARVAFRIDDEAIAGVAPVMVEMSAVAFEQLVVNAIRNAVDAIVARDASETETRPGLVCFRFVHDGRQVHIQCIDDGVGLGSGSHEALFEAFSTTKAYGEGTGLGLYLCRLIVTEVGGQIRIGPRDDGLRGAQLEMSLPLRQSGGTARAVAQAAKPPA